jgi:hypothetical protein
MINVSTDLLKPSRCLVVAFAGVRQKLGGIKSEFYRSLERLDCAALFVRDLECRWYQYDPPVVEELETQIRAAIDQTGAQRLVCIGNSMGGFGALLFGARLGADAILSFAPQTAIEPAVTNVLGDHRWREYQTRIPRFPFGDLAVCVAAKARPIICCGAEDRLDRAHAERLATAWPIEQIVVHSAGHDAAARLRDHGRLVPLIEQAIGG